MGWDPARDYGPEEALKDMLCESSVVDVTLTNEGVIKEYADGHMTMYGSADNAKEHFSIDVTQNSNGSYNFSNHSSN